MTELRPAPAKGQNRGTRKKPKEVATTPKKLAAKKRQRTKKEEDLKGSREL